MEPHELVAVGEAPLVAAARAVSRGPRLDGFAVVLEPGEDLLAVVDLEDPDYPGELSGLGPTRLEYDLDYVVTRVGYGQLRYRVLGGLVLLKEERLLEYLAARRAGEDVVSEREEEAAVVRGDFGFRSGTRPG